MAVTNTLQRAVNVAQNQIRQAPLTGVGGVPNEPALSIGDAVRQTILSPLFAWRWNRTVTTIPLVAGTQDYQQNLPNFGWIEKAVIQDTSNNTFELENWMNLPEEGSLNQPTRIAARLDNDTGFITFRVFPPPDQTYTLTVTSQNAAPSFAALTDTWAPIPDYMWYLVQQGFYAKTFAYMSDERFAYTDQMFMRMLVAASEGLDETQKNIFLYDQLNTARENNSAGSTSANARAFRGGQ